MIRLLLLMGVLVLANCAKKVSENSQLSIDQLVRKYGYPFEVHDDVLTQDGYILQLYRIPSGKDNVTFVKKPVALLMHGLYGTSRNFVAFGPERGLAFHLADRGYDVWLGNARDTRPCRKHLQLNPNTDKKFCDFSWHEIGIYDLPAIIDYILALTHEESINYIGHSQGTTVYFVCTSLKPEYNNRIKVSIGLAPEVYLDESPLPVIEVIRRNLPFLMSMFKLFDLVVFPPIFLLDIILELIQKNCFIDGPYENICSGMLASLDLYDPPQIIMKDVPEYLRDFPSVAARQLFHYGQLIKAGAFRQYDFGRMENFRRYGSVVPPSYNLNNSVAPFAIYYSELEKLQNYRDVLHLCDVLPNCIHR